MTVQDIVIVSNAFVTVGLLAKEIIVLLNKKPKLRISFNPNHFTIKPGVKKMGRKKIYKGECSITVTNVGDKSVTLSGVGYYYDKYNQMMLFESENNPAYGIKMPPGEQRTYYVSHKSLSPEKIDSVIVIDTSGREYLYHPKVTLLKLLIHSPMYHFVARNIRKIKSLKKVRIY